MHKWKSRDSKVRKYSVQGFCCEKGYGENDYVEKSENVGARVARMPGNAFNDGYSVDWNAGSYKNNQGSAK